MGLAEKKRNYTTSTRKEIIQLLNDGEWHRSQDILLNVKGSSATVQKYLNELAKGMVERKENLESKEYPTPVYYRLKPQYVKNSLRELEREWQEEIINMCRDFRTPDYFLMVLNAQLTFSFINILKDYLDNPAEKEAEFSQALDDLILPFYRDNYYLLKDKLKDQMSKGIDIQAILNKTEANLLEYYNQEKPITKMLKSWKGGV